MNSHSASPLKSKLEENSRLLFVAKSDIMSPKAWNNDASIKITALTRLGVCQDRKIGQFAK